MQKYFAVWFFPLIVMKMNELPMDDAINLTGEAFLAEKKKPITSCAFHLNS